MPIGGPLVYTYAHLGSLMALLFIPPHRGLSTERTGADVLYVMASKKPVSMRLDGSSGGRTARFTVSKGDMHDPSPPQACFPPPPSVRARTPASRRSAGSASATGRRLFVA